MISPKIISIPLLLMTISSCGGDPSDPTAQNTYYRDFDGDSFGNSNESISSEESIAPSGYTSNDTDCDDNDNNNFPGNIEVTDGADNDCDGIIDSVEATPIYEYLVAQAAFNIADAVTKCDDHLDGTYTLATWESSDNLAAIIALCQTQSSFCFTQYKVDNGQHISEIDGSAMPSYFDFFQQPPDFVEGRSIMVRNSISFLVEHLAFGYPICGKKTN